MIEMNTQKRETALTETIGCRNPRFCKLTIAP
jgi:hypothetical protein